LPLVYVSAVFGGLRNEWLPTVPRLLLARQRRQWRTPAVFGGAENEAQLFHAVAVGGSGQQRRQWLSLIRLCTGKTARDKR
jgi:hypothetical protein